MTPIRLSWRSFLTAGVDELSHSSQHQIKPEFLRIKGELLLANPTLHARLADDCFRDAIRIARKRSAKSWELRAATSLARLLNPQGRRDEARAMLANIYNWFTEGFDTHDLIDAKALLDG
jgi:predicted ATPase